MIANVICSSSKSSRMLIDLAAPVDFRGIGGFEQLDVEDFDLAVMVHVEIEGTSYVEGDAEIGGPTGIGCTFHITALGSEDGRISPLEVCVGQEFLFSKNSRQSGGQAIQWSALARQALERRPISSHKLF